jgi:putative Mn2+ efflux pump MntP
MPIKLAALLLPLSLDTFAVSAALGVAGLSPRERLRLSLLFAAFEALMPVLGVLGGGQLGRTVGDSADYVAIGVLAIVGLLMLRKDDTELPDDLVARSRGLDALAVGMSVSLDELAIGFTIGLLRLPVVLVLALIAVQAFVATQLGVRLGSRLVVLQERAEQLAGGVLLLLAGVLLALRLTGHAA